MKCNLHPQIDTVFGYCNKCMSDFGIKNTIATNAPQPKSETQELKEVFQGTIAFYDLLHKQICDKLKEQANRIIELHSLLNEKDLKIKQLQTKLAEKGIDS